MKYVIFLAAALSSACTEQTSAEKAVQPGQQSIKALLSEIATLNDLCRGGSGDAPRTHADCDKRDLKFKEAEQRGWCWGPSDVPDMDRRWMRCDDDKPANGPWYAKTVSGKCVPVTLEQVKHVLLGKGVDKIDVQEEIDGTLFVVGKYKDGATAEIDLVPNCDDVAKPEPEVVHPELLRVFAPVGLALDKVGLAYGFDFRDCSAYSVGRGFGCMTGIRSIDNAPIHLSDGTSPCRVGGRVQYDFLPSTGLGSVTCGSNESKTKEFAAKMEATYGAPKVQKKVGFERKLWIVRDMEIAIDAQKIYDSTLHSVHVAKANR